MAFDPDNYLAQPKPSEGFNPDAYLQSAENPQSAYDRFLTSLRNPETFGSQATVPFFLGGTGELIKGAGALTQMAFPNVGTRMVETGEAMLEGAKNVAPISATAGQIGSYLIPFTAAQKSMNAIGAIPSVAKATGMLPSYARAMGQQTAIGGATGYALTPDQENRQQGATFGAVGGAAGELIRPIAKLGGNIASEVIGNLSGVGSQAYKTAYNAAVQGGDKLKALASNLRKQAPMENVVDDALIGLRNMGTNLQNQYRSGMVNVKNDKTILDFAGIDKALNDAQSLGTFKGTITNQDIVDQVSKVRNFVDDWKSKNPADFHTPEGMDELKKAVGGMLEKIPFNEDKVRKAVGGVYSSIKEEIKKQAPVYDDVMKKYSEGLDLASELKKSLSLGNKASVDTSLRKLQSVMRDNVNTNYGNRVNYAEMLEQASGKPIMAQLAGQSLSSPTPRGLQRLLPSATGGSAYALSNPYLLAALPFQSPRLMGEATILAGKASRPVINLANSGTPEQRRIAKLLMMKAAEEGATNE
jgi:hypothetical protein